MSEIDGYEVSKLQAQNLQRSTKLGTVGVVFETDDGRIFIPIEAFLLWEAWGRDEDPEKHSHDGKTMLVEALDAGRKDDVSQALTNTLGTRVVFDKIANMIFVTRVEDDVRVKITEQELLASRWPLARIIKGLFDKADAR